MLTKSGGSTKQIKDGETDITPNLEITNLGIVSRDYGHTYRNGYRDFSEALPAVLEVLDDKGCDAVLFSLFSIIPRNDLIVSNYLKNLKHIKAVFLEEYHDGDERQAERFVTYHMTQRGWSEYELTQKFGTITAMDQKDIEDFVQNEMPRRILGNSCVLLCGETNGVKYSSSDGRVIDSFALRATIPKKVNIVLNPIHDRMIRFEMKLKRKFLSEHGRWVVSVWNKGKKDKNGKKRDGKAPAWTVYYNGEESPILRIETELPAIEIGILNIA